MDKHLAYCSACDRQVEVVVKTSARTNPATGELENEVVCLEMGESCTGSMCPMCDVPTDEMKQSLERLRDSEGS
ncbi:MAG: hypothetical protein JJE01_13720 [Gemmatimonadetes bacterium]|nr:hypothetical protein [Gemmatimonadota bacterium]